VQARLWRPIGIPLRLGRRLLPVLRRVDVVHFHDIDILPWMALLALVRPTVYDVHENYPDEMRKKDFVPRWLRPPLYHVADFAELLCARMVGNCVLVVPAQDRRFRAVRAIHVRNYATRDLLASVRDDYLARPDVAVFTGTHCDDTGSTLLLDIATRCRARGVGLTFVVTSRFSSEEYRRWFMAEIERRHLADRIVIRPYVPAHEIMSVLNQATVALAPNLRVPTQEKAILTKLFEYMAAGLPIVASDLPNQVDFVGGANAGLLARPEEPDTFVDALARLVSDRAYARQLGLNGRRAFLDQYCWETQIPPLLRFYETIVDKGSASPAQARDEQPIVR
jgi:glycosyltransferase involved in cell wall biosynthesis